MFGFGKKKKRDAGGDAGAGAGGGEWRDDTAGPSAGSPAEAMPPADAMPPEVVTPPAYVTPPAETTPPADATPPAALAPEQTAVDAAFQLVCDARDAAWASVGTVDPYVVAPIINPAFFGGPRWPGLRQSFRRVETAGGYGFVTSDGLADPYDDGEGPATGLGVELYLAAEPFQRVGVEGLRDLWQFDAIYQVAQNIAAAGLDLGAELDRFGALSLGLPGSSAPADWLDADGGLGVLVGLTVAGVPGAVAVGPGPGAVRLVGCAALRPDELAAVLAYGAEARRDIAARLNALPPAQLASAERRSVLA